VQYKLETLFSI